MGYSLSTPATPGFRGDLSVPADIDRGAELIASGQAVAVDNDLVYAIWGDAASASFVQTVEVSKGREPGRTFGLSLGAEGFLSLVDRDHVHREAWPLLEDAETFVSRLGALAFVRVPGRPHALEEVPRSVISGTNDKPVVQNWVPEGKTNIEALLRGAEDAGVVHPAVTSLNASGQPEVTSETEALAFAERTRLPILTDRHARQTVLRGSFPIVELTPDGIALTRSRTQCIGSVVMHRLLIDLPLYVPDTTQAPVGIDISELETLSGPELRTGLLEKLGWSSMESTISGAHS